MDKEMAALIAEKLEVEQENRKLRYALQSAQNTCAEYKELVRYYQEQARWRYARRRTGAKAGAQEEIRMRMEEIRAGLKYVWAEIGRLPMRAQVVIGGMTGAIGACVLLTFGEWVVFCFEKIAMR